MILGNRTPEELNSETLLSVAVVLTSIKEVSKDTKANSGLKTFPLEFKFNKLAGIPISRDSVNTAEKSKVEIVKYLKSQGVIEDFIQEPLSSNRLTRHDFLVTIKPKVFSEFYDRTLLLTLPSVEAIIKYQSKPGKVQKLEYKTPPKPEEDIKAELKVNEFSELIIITHYGNCKLPSLKEGRAYDVLMTYKELHFGEIVGLDKIRNELIQMKRMYGGLTNFKQAFRRTLFDVDEGVLRKFVVLKPKYMLINETATLSKQEWQSIVELADSKQKSRQF